MNELKMMVNGIEVTLPTINVQNSFSCAHTVSIDGQPLDVITAIRYLLVRIEQLRTELADYKQKENSESS